MAELIATGTTESDSSDVTIADTESATFSLFVAAGASMAGCVAELQYKASNGQYFTFERLDKNRPIARIPGPVVLRVKRKAAATSFGVDQG